MAPSRPPRRKREHQRLLTPTRKPNHRAPAQLVGAHPHKKTKMAQTFSYCFTCHELCYGIPSNNGVYTKDSAATNHWGHICHNFRDPTEYTPPVKMLLLKLGAGAEISDLEMQIAKIGIYLDPAIKPNYGPKASDETTEKWYEQWLREGVNERPMKQIALRREKPHPRFPSPSVQTQLVWVYEGTEQPAYKPDEEFYSPTLF